MKEFWCGAVVPNCTRRFSAESEEQILQQVSAHAAEEHGMAQVPAEVVQKVREMIRDVA